MGIKNMSKEELELLSNKDITNLLLEEKGNQTTAELYQKIIDALDLPQSTFDSKIGDYFTALSTDKRFILLEDGTWDLSSRHTSDHILSNIDDEDEDDIDLDLEEKDDEDEMMSEDDEDSVYDSADNEDDDFDDDSDDLKDLVVLDEDELEFEQ